MMNRKYQVNKNILLDSDATSFYLLGLYMTDGNISPSNIHNNHFSLSSKDEELLIKIRDLMCPNKPIYQGKKCYVLSMNDADCYHWLISYGCTPRKSLTLKLEKDIPEKYWPDFLRGMLDGDGCITIHQNKYKKNPSIESYICSSSKTIIEQIKNMIPNHIINTITTSQYKTNNIIGHQYRLRTSGTASKHLLNWLYYDNHLLSMERKYKLYIQSKCIIVNNIRRSNYEIENIIELFSHGKTIKEIYNITNIPKSTIRNILYRIKKI